MKLPYFVNKALDGLAPQIHRRCLHYLYTICGGQALIPRSLDVPLCYDPVENPAFPVGLSDVWEGQHEGRKVSAQVFETFPEGDAEEITRVSYWWCCLFIIRTTNAVS